MPKTTHLGTMVVFFLSSLVQAGDAEVKTALDEMDQGHRELNEIFSTKDFCPGATPKDTASSTCSYEALCDKLTRNPVAPKLYGDKTGHSIPNFALIGMRHIAQQCLDNKKNDAITKTVLEKTAKEQASSDAANTVWNTWRKTHESDSDLGFQYGLFCLKTKSKAGSEAEIAEELKQVEAARGRKFSPEGRGKFVRARAATVALAAARDREKSALDATATTPDFMEDLGPGPFFVRKRFEDPANAPVVKKEIDRVAGVFTGAQAKLIAFLGSTKTASNSAKIDTMIERIRTIKMENPHYGASSSGYDCSYGPNAFYGAETHSFTVCPQFLTMPSNAIETIMLHELSHSIDPCNFTKAVPIDHAPGESTHAGAPFASDPLKGAVACLMEDDSVRAKGVPEKACESTPSGEYPQLGEAFADWMAYSVVGGSLAKEPPAKQKQDAFEAVAGLGGMGCGTDVNAKGEALSSWMKKHGCEAKLQESIPTEENLPKFEDKAAADKHPQIWNRVNRIALANPVIAQALGCPGPTPGTVECKP